MRRELCNPNWRPMRYDTTQIPIQMFTGNPTYSDIKLICMYCRDARLVLACHVLRIRGVERGVGPFDLDWTSDQPWTLKGNWDWWPVVGQLEYYWLALALNQNQSLNIVNVTKQKARCVHTCARRSEFCSYPSYPSRLFQLELVCVSSSCETSAVIALIALREAVNAGCNNADLTKTRIN